jgi:hypothetical protein
MEKIKDPWDELGKRLALMMSIRNDIIIEYVMAEKKPTVKKMLKEFDKRFDKELEKST